MPFEVYKMERRSIHRVRDGLSTLSLSLSLSFFWDSISPLLNLFFVCGLWLVGRGLKLENPTAHNIYLK